MAAAPALARRGASAANARQRGMSLLEMLLVIALIAAIGVLTVGALNGGIAGIQLRSASKQIAAQLRYTRSQAIATGRSQKFTIDPAAHTWRAPNGRSGDIPKTVGIVFTGAREVQPRRGEGAIMFFPDGASTGGRVKLHAKQAAWNVDVAWLTGEVKLKRGEAPR
nr:GspH/FimT family pseudopilin [Lysobacter enzymogenes]